MELVYFRGQGEGCPHRASKEGMGLLRRLTAKSFVGRFGATITRGAESALETDPKQLRRKMWCCWCTSVLRGSVWSALSPPPEVNQRHQIFSEEDVVSLVYFRGGEGADRTEP